MQWKNKITGEIIYEVQLECAYADMLDDIYGDVDVCGHTFSSAYALKELDYTAYRCGFLDWIDAENEWEEV